MDYEHLSVKGCGREDSRTKEAILNACTFHLGIKVVFEFTIGGS